MKLKFALTLAATLYILARVVFLKDSFLMFCVGVTLLIASFFAASFFSLREEAQPVRQTWIALLVLSVTLLPLLFGHQIHIEPSNWHEVSAWLDGPYGLLMVFFGVLTMATAVIAALYLGDKYDRN